MWFESHRLLIVLVVLGYVAAAGILAFVADRRA